MFNDELSSLGVEQEFSYLGTKVEIFALGRHHPSEYKWPTSPEGELYEVPPGYVAMVWPVEKPGKPRSIWFHWPDQLDY